LSFALLNFSDIVDAPLMNARRLLHLNAVAKPQLSRENGNNGAVQICF
jgi:hypothetical protein